MFTVNKDALLALLSGEDLTQALRMEKDLKDISDYDYGLIKKYTTELMSLAEKEAGLKKLFVDLKTEESKLSKLEADLKNKQKERETLLVNVRKEKGIFGKYDKRSERDLNQIAYYYFGRLNGRSGRRKKGAATKQSRVPDKKRSRRRAGLAS